MSYGIKMMKLHLRTNYKRLGQQLDETETVILANGYEGYQWTNGNLMWKDSIDEDSKAEQTDKKYTSSTKAEQLRNELTVYYYTIQKIEQSTTTKEVFYINYY